MWLPLSPGISFGKKSETVKGPLHILSHSGGSPGQGRTTECLSPEGRLETFSFFVGMSMHQPLSGQREGSWGNFLELLEVLEAQEFWPGQVRLIWRDDLSQHSVRS